MEVIDIDTLAESCGRAEVSIEEVQQGEGYLEIQDGHSKVKQLKLPLFKAYLEIWDGHTKVKH